MKKNISVSILSLLIVVGLQAQNLESTFNMAEDFKDQGKFELAISSYRRVIFFDSAQLYAQNSYKGLAESYYEALDFELAAYYFDLAYYSTSDNSQKNYLTIQKAASFIQLADYNAALTELFSIDEDNNTNEEFLRNFYIAYAYFGTGNYTSTEKVTIDYLQKYGADSLEITSVRNQFNLLDKSVKKVSRAGLYSRIIPGWGQWYAGDKKAAINSFLLVGTLAAGGVYTTLSSGVLDAATVFGPWFYRYYSGGFGRAEKMVVIKNAENSSLIFKDILDEWVYFYNSKAK